MFHIIYIGYRDAIPERREVEESPLFKFTIMHWLTKDLPWMIGITLVILAILGAGMWHQFSKKTRDGGVRDKPQDDLYLPHVAQGVRSNSDQETVEKEAYVPPAPRELDERQSH